MSFLWRVNTHQVDSECIDLCKLLPLKYLINFRLNYKLDPQILMSNKSKEFNTIF